MKDLTQEISPHLPGRLARYVASITEARSRGVTWRQITEAIGPEVGLSLETDDNARRLAEKRMQVAYRRARVQVEKGRLKSGPAQAAPDKTGTPGAPASGFKTL